MARDICRLLRQRLIVLGILVVTVTCITEASGSHGNTNPPPPPRIRRILNEYYRPSMKLPGTSTALTEPNHAQASEYKGDLQKQTGPYMESGKLISAIILLAVAATVICVAAQGAAGQAQTMDEGTGPTYKLRFHGSLKARIYKNKPLLKHSDEGIEIAIYRDDRIITSGDLSSVSVEIVALESDHTCKGSWTEEDFHRQIQMRRGGQGSVLEGDRSMKLVNGKAPLGKVWFSEGSSGTRSREFVLAARIDMSKKIEGLRVEEAFMQPAITVLVERSEENEKSVLPMLNEKVRRLKKIAKVYSQRLEQDGICTVQDFLKALNEDENKLRQILKMKSKSKSWKVLVRHARESDLRDEHELKPYMVEGENVILFFNCIHDNVGAEVNGRYIAKDKFDPIQKALVDRLKKQVYNELEGIDFQYVMKDNRPQKISANVNAAGSSSIPMSGASPRNTSDHHAHAVSQAVEKLGPSGIGPEPEPDLPLGGANCNAAGPSPPDQHYTHQSQGVAENSVPEEDAIRPDTATTDVDWLDQLAWTIRTPYGPDSDPLMPTEDQSQIFWANHRSFGEFSPPEDQSQNFWPAPSGGGGN